MIGFVNKPILENRVTGCHGNHAFSHSPIRFINGEFFSHSEGPREKFDTNSKLSLGCKVGEIRW